MTLAHLNKLHRIQLIINITVTPQVSYIPNLYSENIWRTEFNLDNLKLHLVMIICYIFLGFSGLDLMNRIHIRLYCGNLKEGCVKHYTFTAYNAKLNVNLDNCAVN